MLPSQFDSFAEEILSLKTSQYQEALVRTYIGRKYYSIFLSVEQWLRSRFVEELNIHAGSSHERVRNCCHYIHETKSDSDFLKLKLKLGYLHDFRCRADYQLDLHLDHDNCEVMKRETDRAFKVLEDLQKKYSLEEILVEATSY